MGDKSDSKTKQASSPYVVLENRPLDLWKVTELKEELKKRKLITRGLKEELVKRLDEAIRAEMDDDKSNLETDLNSEAQPEAQPQSDDAENTENLEKDNKVDDLDNKTDEKTDVEIGTDVRVSTQVESLKVVQEISVETTVMVSEESAGGGLNQEPRNGEPKPESQVDEVSKVQTDSISIDSISNIEKNELKDNVIADDVKLEINVKPDSKPEAVEVAEEKDIENVENIGSFNENDNVIATDVRLVNEPLTENVDILKKNDSGDAGSSEKLNLDRSSGDDSMEEDALESKQIDSKFSSDEVGNKSEKVEVKEDDSVHAMVEDATDDKSFVGIEDKASPSVTSAKRKPHDPEKAAENNELLKRQRRWNSENLEVPKQQPTNRSTSTTPKDAFQTPAKHAFSRSESTNSQDLPKERVVPPSSKAPTTSLRIDNFLRPFTLKAVQEFLGKTGTVVSFWMDQIKTHCYITYASVEEAIETRNAVCNLQWPVNGGRLLMADFVDPQEVKNRVDPPPPSPATLTTTIPTTTMQPPQPSPRLKQQLPPSPALPPPPPLSNPLPARNRAPPPPPVEKIDPPIVTLDDLFKKTRATPRIYYLPLSDEKVAAKLNAQGKQSGNE